MNNRPLISIVANFYKSERYIDRLVKSVVKQTYTNWELIAVDDCSPGQDLRRLRKWQDKIGSRMRVISNPENLGISKAKRVGIEAARGEYITFCDGDDWLTPDALQVMLEPMLEHNLDMVMGDCYRVFPPAWLDSRNKRYMKSKAEYGRVLEHDKFRDKHFLHFFGIHTLAHCSYWGHLYRTSIVKDIHLPHDMPNEVFEDGVFNMLFAEKCQRMMFVDKPVYNWRWGGISSGASRDKKDYSCKGVIRQYAWLYRLRMDTIRRLDFKQGIIPMQIELKNVLVASLRDTAEYAPDSPEADSAKKLIEWCYTMPEYDDMALVKPDAHPPYYRFVELYKARDTEGLYCMLHDIYQQNSRLRLAKRIISLFT